MTEMRIIRPGSIEILNEIKPLLTVFEESLRDLAITDIASLMINHPASLLFLVGYDDDDGDEGDERDEVKAFLIAKDPGPIYPFTMVLHLWSHPLNPRKWFDTFFARLIVWTVAHDKRYIKAETQRNLKAFCKRFNFQPFSQTVRFDLEESHCYKQLIHHPEEIINHG